MAFLFVHGKCQHYYESGQTSLLCRDSRPLAEMQSSGRTPESMGVCGRVADGARDDLLGEAQQPAKVALIGYLEPTLRLGTTCQWASLKDRVTSLLFSGQRLALDPLRVFLGLTRLFNGVARSLS